MNDLTKTSLKMSSGDKVLLLVDDEENILNSLTRVFRREGYRIVAALSGAEGLKILEAESVGVILSDQRMPEMTGVEFLRQAKQRFPDTVRLVLSGYTELTSVTDAINEGAIYKFLTKPWDDDQLRAHVREAFDRYGLKFENARLARELSVANRELSALNVELEQRVTEKTHELTVNVQTLQMAQEILEHLPAAVMGLADDDIVAVANRRAYALFGEHAGMLVGESFGDVVPDKIVDAVKALRNENASGAAQRDLILDGVGTVSCAPLLYENAQVRGWIIVIS